MSLRGLNNRSKKGAIMPAYVDTMFSGKGVIPWHKQGTVIEGTADVGEAIKLSGLDFPIVKDNIPHTKTGEPTDFSLIYRGDTNKPFQTVSNGYRVHQNEEIFSFMDSICANGAKFHTAGSLFGGAKIWMLAQFPKELRIMGTDDITKQYLLATSSHDGSMSTVLCDSEIRVVCDNTRRMALAEAATRGLMRFSHKGKALETKLPQVQKFFGIIGDRVEEREKLYNEMAHRLMSRVAVEDILAALYPLEEGEDDVTKSFNHFHHEAVKNLWEDNDAGQISKIAGTAYSFFQAVIRYEDHYRSPRNNYASRNAERSMDNLLFGEGFKVKETAARLITKDLPHLTYNPF